MDIGTFVAASIAGGLGAMVRWVIDLGLTRRVRAGFPWGIWVVNVSGSLALGLATGLLANAPAEFASLATVLGAGLLGGYTTFSTVSVVSVTLWHAGARRIALLNIVGTFVACLGAAYAGVALGGVLAGNAAL